MRGEAKPQRGTCVGRWPCASASSMRRDNGHERHGHACTPGNPEREDDMQSIKALLFDVFGTCVDWRGGIVREGQLLSQKHGIGDVDWAKFADAWRALYHPQMEKVRSGQRDW